MASEIWTTERSFDTVSRKESARPEPPMFYPVVRPKSPPRGTGCGIRRAFPAAFLFAMILPARVAGGAAEPPPHHDSATFLPAPPRRFIPMSQPRWLSPAECGLKPEERVAGIEADGEARCYPLRLIAYHHVVNDTIGGVPLAATYCVLADTAAAFRLPAPETQLRAAGLFGGVMVLGREGGGELWPQIARTPVPGHPLPAPLAPGPPMTLTTWGEWSRAHPETRVLAPDERRAFDYEVYDRRPTKDLHPSQMIHRTRGHADSRLPPGERVFGIAAGGDSAACTLAVLKSRGAVEIRLSGSAPVELVWDKELGAPKIKGSFAGTAVQAYWYAWAEFYPETTIVESAPSAKPEDRP